MGLPFSTRATLVRMSDGRVWVHSPIRRNAAAEASIRSLGSVGHLIAPNWIHYAYVDEWAKSHPDARIWAAPGVSDRARKKGIPFPDAASLGDVNPWSGEIETLFVEGSGIHKECVFFHHASKTLILTDLIENFEPSQLRPPFRWLVQAAGIAHPDGQIPPDMALSFRKGRPSLRAAILQMLDWEPEKVIVAHGKCYEADGVKELRRAFRRVLR